MVRRAKSPVATMKPKMVITWKARPAIMMLEPRSGDSLLWDAMDARAPPRAWRTREMTSQGMNY